MKVIDWKALPNTCSERWISSLEQGRIPQAILLLGSNFEDLARVALGFAQDLVCTEKLKSPSGQNTEACGECGACRRIEKKSSEALLQIEPVNQIIKVEAAREILDFLSLSSISRYRVIIIHQAQFLGSSAANALLKILEEPPPEVLFILTAQHRRQILATLRSRSFVLNWPAGLSTTTASGPGSEMIKMWQNDAWAYLSAPFREKIKDRRNAHALAKDFQFFFRDQVFQNAQNGELSSEPDFYFFEKSVELEAELNKYRDPLAVFEEFWIKTQRVRSL